LDGYATGTAGAGGNGNAIANLDVNKKLIQTELSKIDMRTPGEIV
jgi:hypothetical protein